MYKKFLYRLMLTTVAALALDTQAMAADVPDAVYLKKRGTERPKTGPVKFAVGAVVVGNQPEGYGSVAIWDRKEKENIFVCFIAAKDDLGTAIVNLKKGDRVEVLYATGMAEFSGKKGEQLESIVTFAVKGAAAAGAAAGKVPPQALRAIEKGADYAGKVFKMLGDSDVRDAYGKDKNRETKRQEGGVLICMPEAGGVFYSGGDRKRWVQGKDGGERTDDRQPEHMKGRGAFFPIQGNQAHNTRTAKADGILHLIAWDFNFPDNSGYYRVIIRVTRVD
jgi:hypothetical protein